MGMSQEVKEHLFEPFFTTKDDRHGSGLGLATCYGIVGQSGGHITVESELAKGTAVHIYLPEVAAPPAAAYRKRPKLPNGNETILVVEDDISVRHVAVRTLRMLGYNVLEAFRADEAKRLIENTAINLVVSDIVLPDMSGCDFADWMRINSPSTQILLTSGYLPEMTTIGTPSSELTGMEIFCKLDNLQRTGSFKERGARNVLSQLPADQKKRGVIAASAGNHGQALAYQGKLLGVPATVVMPKHAPLIKVSNCQKLGARVVLHGKDFAEAKTRSRALIGLSSLPRNKSRFLFCG